MIINTIYEHQNVLSMKLVSLLVGLRTYQHPCTIRAFEFGCIQYRCLYRSLRRVKQRSMFCPRFKTDSEAGNSDCSFFVLLSPSEKMPGYYL
jgi:hypothetical protein